jgi:mannosidase alpha-like ER degradation enhancer 1
MFCLPWLYDLFTLIDWNLWRRHSGLPEVWDINYRVGTSFQYPLRPGNSFYNYIRTSQKCIDRWSPEFIESTWYLYRVRWLKTFSILGLIFCVNQATRDPFYLDVGERILNDLIYRTKVDCGLTGIQDLRTNHRDDRMESFALSETLKVGIAPCRL